MTTKWDANAPTESTRLLQDSVRISRENEEIGENRTNYANLPLSCALTGRTRIFDLSQRDVP